MANNLSSLPRSLRLKNLFLGDANPTTGGGGSYILNKGAPVFDWSSVTPSFSGSTASKQSAITFNGEASALRLINTASPVADITGLSIDFTGFKNLVVPIYRAPGAGRTVVSVFATKGGFTNYLGFNIVVDDVGWAEYGIVPEAVMFAGAAALDSGYTQIRVRLQDDANTYSYGIGAGDTYVGNIRLNMLTRPKLIFTTDDGSENHVTATLNGKTIKSILDVQNIKATAYVVPRTFGAIGHETAATFLALKAAGWSIANHSWAHPSSPDGLGLRLLGPVGYAPRSVASVDTAANTITCTVAHNIIGNGTITQYYAVEFVGSDLPAPLVTGTIYYARSTSTTAFTVHPTWQDVIANTNAIDLTTTGTAANFTWRFGGSANDHTAIQADLLRAKNEMIAAGFSADDASHFALPQGSIDQYVVTACENLGLYTVRGTYVSGRNPGANVAGRTRSSNPQVTARRHNLPGTRQADSVSVTEQNLTDYVDAIIAQGATGTILVHALTTATIAKLEAVAAYARAKSDLGLVDIVTVDQWWRGFAGDRAKLPMN